MLIDLVSQARRRFLWNEVLAQFAWALSAALGALILLLLLGTQILDWYWLILLPGGAFGFGVYRVWRSFPSAYEIAQLCDYRLALADGISTALYFASQPSSASDWVRNAQRAHAEEMARHARVEEAIPFRMPRAAYAMALLGVVATSLFALRYGLDRRLDLRPPLARVLAETFDIGQPHPQELARRQPPAARKDPREEQMGMALSDQDRKGPGELDAAPDSALEASTEPNVDNSKVLTAKAEAKGQQNQSAEQDSEGESVEEGQSSAPGQDQGEQGQGKSMPKGQSATARQDNGSSGENSSLMNKFRDAMQNLLSRVRQQPSASGMRQQAAASQNARQQGANQTGQGGQRGNQGQQAGTQSSEAQDGDNAEDARNGQNAQGKGTGQSSEQASKQPGSGIGSEDGSKDVKLAQQLAAMGKISEIIGKRSANVTGEVTVEVQSSSQQLHTAYTQHSARHLDSGGEISRDEVPVALQQYVQQYFEQVRRQPPDTGRRAEATSGRREAARELPKDAPKPPTF